MSDLRSIIQDIQREVGTEADGVFGPVTAARVLFDLRKDKADPDLPQQPLPAASTDDHEFDARTERNIATLDPKARPMFRKFIALAKATAATLGCDYVLTDGNRTYAEQDALYAKGRSTSGEVVTNAKGGQSNHNFGIAGDFGVFKGGIYLDSGTREQQQLAEKVHKACSLQAAACGLEWGGSWRSIVDQPHYEVKTGLTLPQKRELMSEKGSVL